MDISSSQIRERLMAGADPHALAGEGLIPASVADYIARHPGFYRPRPRRSTLRRPAEPGA